MNELAKKIGGKLFGETPEGCCPCCKAKIGAFRDTLSQQEFKISGMCQKCQDKTFVEHPEDRE